MTQTQAQEKYEAPDGVELSFKRHILEQSRGFASEPMEDLLRVNLLSRMLDRYDELRAKGLGEVTSQSRVLYEYADIAARMRAEGFADIGQETASGWPKLTEAEAEIYIRERDAYLHKQSMGSGLTAACCMPLMMMNGLSELIGFSGDAAAMLGLVGMFGMIGMGVYSITAAKKPKNAGRIKKGHFALADRLRRKLEAMKEDADDRARRRMGKGIAMLVMCALPIFAGAAFDSLFFYSYSDAGAMIGVGGMFAMIGAGVYELVMADGEKKTMKHLLNEEKK